jgi:simple sugar transport system ATP-binding protein
VKRGMIDFGFTRRAAASIIERFKVKAAGPDAPAKSLSGGNLQKFIVGREIERKPAVFVVAQPTWGVDVGAAAQIHGEILKLKQEGCAVLVISEELDELFAICDRLHVIAKGDCRPPFPSNRPRASKWACG